MTRPIPDVAVDFIAQHEGCKLKAYQDSVSVWTVGFGSTSGVHEGLTITLADAKGRLKTDLRQAADRIEARIGDVVEILTDNQYAALLSLVFNVGAGASWTIWKRLKAHQFDQVPGEIIKFCNAGGVKVQGLVNRRTDEIKLWSTDEPGSVPEVAIPSSVTRAADTPPTPTDPTPAGKSATIIGGALTVCGTVPVAAKTVIDAVSPYQEYAPLVGKLIAAAGVAGAVAAIVVLVLNYLKKREARL